MKVPLSYVTLNVKKGGAGKPEGFETKPMNEDQPTVPESVSCRTTRTATSRTSHRQPPKGTLAYPFQPYGNMRLCLSNAFSEQTYTASYNNSTVAGNTVTIYPAEPTKAEREAEEKTKRTAWKKGQEDRTQIALAERTTKEATQTTERITDEASGDEALVTPFAVGKPSC